MNRYLMTFFLILLSCHEKSQYIYIESAPKKIQVRIDYFTHKSSELFYVERGEEGEIDCYKIRETYFSGDTIDKKVFSITYPTCGEKKYFFSDTTKTFDYLDAQIQSYYNEKITIVHYKKIMNGFVIYCTFSNKGFLALILFPKYWIKLHLNNVNSRKKQEEIINSIKSLEFNSEYDYFAN